MLSQAFPLPHAVTNIYTTTATNTEAIQMSGQLPPRVVRCHAPGCALEYTERRTFYRHFREKHKALANGLSHSLDWGIDLEPRSGGESDASAASAQAVTPVAASGRTASAARATVATPSTSTPQTSVAPPVDWSFYYAGPPSYSTIISDVVHGEGPAPSASAVAPFLTHLPKSVSVTRAIPRLSNSWQLRSSRSTRNQEHSTAPRNRAGVIDWDPTEGLPVRKWEQVSVKINQDTSLDPIDSNDQNAENHESDFPWPELPLPNFYNQLAPHSQVSSPVVLVAHDYASRYGNSHITLLICHSNPRDSLSQFRNCQNLTWSPSLGAPPPGPNGQYKPQATHMGSKN